MGDVHIEGLEVSWPADEGWTVGGGNWSRKFWAIDMVIGYGYKYIYIRLCVRELISDGWYPTVWRNDVGLS